MNAIRWMNGTLQLLDQRKLPHLVEYLELTTAAAVSDAIRDMVVRGAPAIGITAAYGVVLSARQHYRATPDNWRELMRGDMARLLAARPTAVNLRWAMERLGALADTLQGDPVPALTAEAGRIHDDDIAANRHMGELGAAYIDGEVLTHCNTGSLATGGYGTALGVIRSAWAGGKLQQVFADETRPWMQGSRLTAWELVQDNIPVTLICEGAAGALMRQGGLKWVIVGADRVVANGDVANKIGTYNLAVNARHHGLGFMVVAPTSTIDLQTASGEGIEIESRAEAEVLAVRGERIAAAGAGAWNPVFDVTPAALVDVLVTERGVVERPDTDKISDLMG